MLKTLFDPSGECNPEEFMRGAIVVIAATFLIQLLDMVNVNVARWFDFTQWVIFYCWIALFIKRYHYGEQTGWLLLIPGILAIFLNSLVTLCVLFVFAGDTFMMFWQALVDASLEGNKAQINTLSLQYAPILAKKTALPSGLATAMVSYGIAWVFNWQVIPVHK